MFPRRLALVDIFADAVDLLEPLAAGTPVRAERVDAGGSVETGRGAWWSTAGI